jgi:glycosyltransferase involved in cell wall biosynthesis
MHIAAYVQVRRTMGNVTGVGRHMLNMILGLSRQPGVEVTVLGSREDMRADVNWPLRSLPMAPLPFSTGVMERLWWATNRPRVEHYCPDADWVYCAADAYVPTRKAHYAVTIHDLDPMEANLPWSDTPTYLRSRRIWPLRLRPMLKHAKLIVTVSEYSKSRIVEVLGVDPARIAVVYNGVDERFFQPASTPWPDHPRQRYGPYVAIVGGLTQRKGAEWVLKVAAQVKKMNSDLHFVVIGKSDPNYSRRAAELSNISELGFLDDQFTPTFLRDASSMLYLSRYEGFGMPILEAMAVGAPAVVGNFSSLPEVAADAGIVVDVNNPESIAQTLIEIADNQKVRDKWSELGLAHARRFTWDYCVNRLFRALNEAV